MSSGNQSARTRARTHKPLRLTSAEIKSLDRLELRLGHRLHPLSRTVPIPENKIWLIQMRLDREGWKAKVALVQSGKQKMLLCDAGLLQAWVDLKRGFNSIPKACILSISEEDAVEWHFRHNIGERTEWQPGQRAAAAAAAASFVSDNREKLKAKLGLSANAYTDDVIAEMCPGVSKRLLGYAKALLNRHLGKRFRNVLMGIRGGLRAHELDESPAHGMRSRKCGITLVDFSYTSAPRLRDCAHVALVDQKLSLMDSINAQHIHRIVRERGYVVFLCCTAPDKAKILSWLNCVPRVSSGGVFKLIAKHKALSIVHRGSGLKREAVFRTVFVFSRHTQPLGQKDYVPVLKRDLRKDRDARECRVLAYQRLLQSFCPHRNGRVFAPCSLNGDTARDRILLSCLKSAAMRRRVRLLVYAPGGLRPSLESRI